MNSLRKPCNVSSPEETAKLVTRFIRKSLEHNVNLAELSSIKNNSSATKIQSSNHVLFGIIILSAVALIPWFCMDFDDCYINIPAEWKNAFRVPVSCDFCRDVNQVQRIASVRPNDFEKKFAYNSVPVIVTDATVNWTAMQVQYLYNNKLHKKR